MRDPGPLNQAASQCQSSRQNNNQYRWGYEFHGLTFRPLRPIEDRLRHHRPRTLREVAVELHLSLSGPCLDDGHEVDPFDLLTVELELTGETASGQVLTAAWHLDRHPVDSDPDPESHDSAFAHPHYHFHCGGRRLWPKPDSEFGTHLVLEAPRVAHPPMDAVLGVDFVLSNYFGSQWKALRSDSPVYRSLVHSAQQRLWRPYAMAAADHWITGKGPWDSLLVWPQLFPFGTEF